MTRVARERSADALADFRRLYIAHSDVEAKRGLSHDHGADHERFTGLLDAELSRLEALGAGALVAEGFVEAFAATMFAHEATRDDISPPAGPSSATHCISTELKAGATVSRRGLELK